MEDIVDRAVTPVIDLTNRGNRERVFAVRDVHAAHPIVVLTVALPQVCQLRALGTLETVLRARAVFISCIGATAADDMIEECVEAKSI